MLLDTSVSVTHFLPNDRAIYFLRMDMHDSMWVDGMWNVGVEHWLLPWSRAVIDWCAWWHFGLLWKTWLVWVVFNWCQAIVLVELASAGWQFTNYLASMWVLSVLMYYGDLLGERLKLLWSGWLPTLHRYQWLWVLCLQIGFLGLTWCVVDYGRWCPKVSSLYLLTLMLSYDALILVLDRSKHVW